jgi:hypothetical protein
MTEAIVDLKAIPSISTGVEGIDAELDHMVSFVFDGCTLRTFQLCQGFYRALYLTPIKASKAYPDFL